MEERVEQTLVEDLGESAGVQPAMAVQEEAGPKGSAAEVRLSQAGLDKLIDKAFARGVKRGAKKAAVGAQDEQAGVGGGLEENGTPADGAGDSAPFAGAGGDAAGGIPSADEDAGAHSANPLQVAEEMLAEASTRLLAASVRGAAPGLGITGRGADAALRLCDFTPCLAAGGLPDEAAVSTILAEFLEQWPEFAAVAPPPPFAPGTGSAPVAAGDAFRERLGL